MDQEEKVLPYHLSIIPIIKEIELDEVFFFKKVLKTTMLPPNSYFYDQIIELWKKRMKELCFYDSTGVVENLEERKKSLKI